MRTDQLIEQLAAEVRPVRALAAPWTRATMWLSVSAVYLLLLVALMSPNPAGIAGIRSARFWLEQAAASTTAAAAALAALASIIPGRSRRWWLAPIVPMLWWMGMLAWGCVRDVMATGVGGLTLYSDWPCVFAMALGAVVPAFVMARMLGRGAPLAPRPTGACAALAGAALGSVAACVSRAAPHPTAMTVVAWHFGTLLMFVSAGAWCGSRFLDWRVSPSMGRTQ